MIQGEHVQTTLAGGTDPLPTGAEALDEAVQRIPVFLRIECDRCGKDRMISGTHTARGETPIRDILDRSAMTWAATGQVGRLNPG
jgi:hypothetical protein